MRLCPRLIDAILESLFYRLSRNRLNADFFNNIVPLWSYLANFYCSHRIEFAAAVWFLSHSGSGIDSIWQAGRYSPKLALSFKFALSDHGGGSCPARAAVISGFGSLGIAAMPRDPFPRSASMVGMTANATRNRAVA
jgi:hypothetical protein